MSTQISVSLPDQIYQHLDYLAQISNQHTADIISNILNGAFKGVTQMLNVSDIEVVENNELTPPQIMLTLPDATSNFLHDLLQPGSDTTAPELIVILIPQDKNIPALLTATIVGNLDQFSSRFRAEKLVSKLSDSELRALIDAKGQLAVSNPMEEQLLANRSALQTLLQDTQYRVNRYNAARNEAYRRGLITFSEMLL